MPKLSVELDYVGTTGHKLFRADDVNRLPGAKLPDGSCTVDEFGRTLCGTPSGRLNGNYGNLRVWENAANSNYNSLQVAVKKQVSHGLGYRSAADFWADRRAENAWPGRLRKSRWRGQSRLPAFWPSCHR